jgi:hypothetical protein
MKQHTRSNAQEEELCYHSFGVVSKSTHQNNQIQNFMNFLTSIFIQDSNQQFIHVQRHWRISYANPLEQQKQVTHTNQILEQVI